MHRLPVTASRFGAMAMVVVAAAVVACVSEVHFLGPAGKTGSDSTAGFSITLTPDPVTVAVGASVHLSARVQDALGNILTGRAISWGSSAPSIAAVDSTGAVTGVTAGHSTINVSSGSLGTSANVEVDPVPVASVSVTPRFDTLQVGSSAQLSAATKDAVGNPLTGRQITWASNNGSIALVSGNGVVTAIAVGGATISATSEGVVGTSSVTIVNVPVASVQVTPPLDTVPLGGTQQLTATPRDSGGGALTGRPVTWSTGNAGVATVSSNGQVSGVGVGSTTITASSGGQSGSATVVIIAVPVASVTVSPATPSIQVGATTQLAATTRDGKGNILSGRVVTWASGTPAAATVNGSGLVTGVAAGSSVVTATSETVSGTATVSVTTVPPTLVRIILTPAADTLNGGASAQFTAVGKLSDSSTTAVTATWSATGGTVSSGLYTAGQSAGTFRVIAKAQGHADTSAVTVTLPPVAMVTVSPTPDTIAVGGVQQLSATTKDGGGNVLTGRVVTWSSGNVLVATVTSGGVVTAVAPGSTAITATSETVPGSASVVTKVVLAATVQVSPSGGSVIQGQTTALTATARDASGNVLNHPVTWTSLSPTIATVNSSGVVSGITVGTASIRAVVDTANGSSSVSVDSSSTAAPWVLEDFSSYSSTANMLSDPRGIYSLSEDVETNQMALDLTVGYGGLNRSMRYDFPDRTAEGGSGTSGRCTDNTVGRNISFPSQVTEVWVEVAAKFAANFTTVAPSSWGCTSAPAYKFVFGRTPTGRFNLVLGIFGSEYTFGWPANQEPADYPMPFTPFDGQWHVYRMHFKVSTPAGSSSANGACELWVDGVLVKSFTGIVETNAYIYGLAIGRNMNQGPGQAESLWWGRVAVWKTNPGW